MGVGRLARRILGDRWFGLAGTYYRSIFVDLDELAGCLPEPPPGASILDVGGGDGAVIDRYLERHIHARVTMIDLAPRIGMMLRPGARERVELLPGTGIAAYRALGRRPPDLVTISDVVHHVPEADRRRFFADVRDLLAGHRGLLVVKDVQPGSLRAWAGLASDRWVSGDRNAQLIGWQALVELVTDVVPCAGWVATPLLERDPPNYCIVFTTAGE